MAIVNPVDERQARQVAEAARETSWHRPSFGRQLFLGDFQLGLIHPHPRPTGDSILAGEQFCTRLLEFCRTRVDGARIERDAEIPGDVVKGLAELGAFGMKIAPEYGGRGLSQLYYNRALMIIGSASPALGALVSAHQSIGVPQPLALFGTDEQKRQFLPRCAAGEISAFLLTEPDVGSDPARLRTQAVPSQDGSEYVLDGVKLWTTNGVVAGLLVVMAQVPPGDGHRGGITAFVVPGDCDGVTVENRNAFMGLRGIENGVTRFHQVRVPAANRIGAEGQGLKIALTTLNTGRLSLPAMCAAAGKWSLKIAREWSAERVQWGRPVGQHEAIAKKISFIAATSYALEAMVDLASGLADDKRNDIRLEAALAKLYASEMAWLIADELVQIRGGRGYETAASLAARGERGIPAEQVLRDLRINRIFEGSTEIMHLFIAREAVDTHLSVAGELIEPGASLSSKARAAGRAGSFYARWLPTLMAGEGQRPGGYREFGPLAAHMRYVERTSRRLARATFYGMSRWQGRLERKQGFLGRIVDIGAELFAMSAACVRAQMDSLDALDAARASDASDASGAGLDAGALGDANGRAGRRAVRSVNSGVNGGVNSGIRGVASAPLAEGGARAGSGSIAAGGGGRPATSYELADAFCAQARVRIGELFGRLWDNTDALDVRIAKRVLEGRYGWLEEGIVDPSTEGPLIAAAEPGPSERANVHRAYG